MGNAILAALDRPVRRRIAAAAVSLCANIGLLAFLLFIPRSIPAAPEVTAIDIVLFTAPEAEPDPVSEPDTVPEPDTVDIAIAQTATPSAAVDGLAAAEDGEVDDPATGPGGASGSDIIVLPEFHGEALPLPAGRGSTQMVLREIFCLNSSDATRAAGNCPDTPVDGSIWLENASPENLARAQAAFNLSPAQIRAVFGERSLPLLNDLTGQAATSNTHSQATSAADSMRDSLPAQHPDPAFGD